MYFSAQTIGRSNYAAPICPEGRGEGKYLAAALCSVQFIVSEWVMDLPLMG